MKKEHPFTADTLAQWCARQQELPTLLDEVTKYNPRLGVWLSCFAAREVLQVVQGGECSPVFALIEVAEQWVKDPEENKTIAEKAAKEAYYELCRTANTSRAREYAYAYAYYYIDCYYTPASLMAVIGAYTCAYVYDYHYRTDKTYDLIEAYGYYSGFKPATLRESKRLCGLIAETLTKVMAVKAIW